VAAGIQTLRILRDENPYPALEEKTRRLADSMADAAGQCGIDLAVNQVGSMMTAFFTAETVTDYASARTSDTQRYAAFFNLMLGEGIYLAPSQFESAFVSTAHTDEDIGFTLSAAERAFCKLA
jgi:glutamate-1-semialdehyde 2,1-aminomutase